MKFYRSIIIIKLFLFCNFTYAIDYIPSPKLGIRLPNKGGVEDFGVQRPSSCDPSLSYVKPIFRKYSTITSVATEQEEMISALGPKIAKDMKTMDSNTVMGFIRSNEEKSKTEWYTNTLNTAEQYTKIVAGNRDAEQILQEIRQGNAEFPKNCSPSAMKNMGGSQSVACAATSQLMEVLANTELFHLVVCLAEGQNTNMQFTTGPSLGIATTSSSTSSNNSSKNSYSKSNNNNSNNTNPSTKSELKEQIAEQEPQSAVQEAQIDSQRALDNQAKANQKRQGKRKTHDPSAEASKCISPDFGGLYGAMDNSCEFKVWFTYCAFRPKKDTWASAFDCEQGKFGTDLVGAKKSSATHTHGAERIYWFACKDPAWPLDAQFVLGDGVKGRCHDVGGE